MLGFISRNILKYTFQQGFTDNFSCISMRNLCCSFLERSINKNLVNIHFPIWCKSGIDIIILHDLNHSKIKYTRIPHVVTEYITVSIFFSCPHKIPFLPNTVRAEIGRNQPMEVREPFFS